MTKDAAQLDEEILYEGEWLTIRAMRRPNGRIPAAEWLSSLQERYQLRFFNAAETVEVDLRDGRNSGRTEKVLISEQGLRELKITPAGGRAPHLRMLYLRRGRTLWVAQGFKKQTNALRKRDVNPADRITEEWIKSQSTRRRHD